MMCSSPNFQNLYRFFMQMPSSHYASLHTRHAPPHLLGIMLVIASGQQD